MHSHVSAIWRHLPSDLIPRTERCIDAACERLASAGSGYIYFRADDVAVPGKKFARLLSLFKHYRMPLCLAVVPAWLTRLRWQSIKTEKGQSSSLWCWHQHGWRHVNYETDGKKQEFGSARATSEIKQDLIRGKQRLEHLMQETFYPVFTPPWNRCSLNTLQVLRDLGYVAVSRSRGSKPLSPGALPDFYVNIDLHTRKEHSAVAGWNNLLREFEQAIASSFCGIMIHHQRMNDAAFDFLELLLKALIKRKKLQLVNFKDLADLEVF
jgi:peptidoglycan/xylan/chitin deacetylase (PgdA/CDA1 family)